MMYTLTVVLFFLGALSSVFFWVGMWQSREYRRDRLMVQLRETIQGRSVLFSPFAFVKWILLLFYGVVVFFEPLTGIYQLSITLVFAFGVYLMGRTIVMHRLKRPVLTKKALLISIVSMASIYILYEFRLTEAFVWLLFVDRMTVWIVSFFVFLMAFPSELYRDIRMYQAKQRLQSVPSLCVIAVSGSYGKTSTKEYIAQVLAHKKKVVKTPASHNTPLGIAETILSHITPQTEVFVVEIGAYKKGEIAEICQFVKPTISVTTSLSDQHLSLFGSMEQVIETEYELLQALPKDGLALFNGNNALMQKLIAKTKKKKYIYAYTMHKPRKKDSNQFLAYSPTMSEEGVSFRVDETEKQLLFTAPLLGLHTIENILPAIFLGKYFGMTDTELQDSVASLIPPQKTMNKKVTQSEVTYIDDTFNISPESVFAAMDYLRVYKQKKFFVLSPLIELGDQARNRYRQIGKKAKESCDVLFVFNTHFLSELQEEAGEACEVVVQKTEVIAQMLSDRVKKGDVVLFEGKEAKGVLDLWLLEQKNKE